jgi:hypothetical protein
MTGIIKSVADFTKSVANIIKSMTQITKSEADLTVSVTNITKSEADLIRSERFFPPFQDKNASKWDR